MAGEEWRPIAGFEGRYEVSSLGRVRSLRIRTGACDKLRASPKIMRATGSGHNGYLTLRLARGDGAVSQRRVHQLVLEAFVGPCPAGMGGCHVDDRDKSNNALTNLEWKTQKGNMEDRERHGTTARGERAGRAKLTEADVLAIRADRRTHAVLAEIYGVGPTTIGYVKQRETWKHV